MSGSVLADIPFDGKRRAEQTIDGSMFLRALRVGKIPGHEVVYGEIDQVLHTAGFKPQEPKDSSRPDGEAD